MALIIEDGTNVEGANSFVSLSFARAYANDRGVTLPADDDALSAMLIESTDYLDAQECKLQGERTYDDQSLSWPRTGVIVRDGDEVPAENIPSRIKAAQVRLAMAIHEGIELMPNSTPQSYVKREKVGPLETEYADPLSVGIGPSLPAVDALISPFTSRGCAGGMALVTRRV